MRRSVRTVGLSGTGKRLVNLQHGSGLRLPGTDGLLDVGCGTGPNFEPLRTPVGPTGQVVGIDFSPRMVKQAEKRTRAHGWTNVSLNTVRFR